MEVYNGLNINSYLYDLASSDFGWNDLPSCGTLLDTKSLAEEIYDMKKDSEEKR